MFVFSFTKQLKNRIYQQTAFPVGKSSRETK